MAVSEQIISVLNALCEKFGVAVDWTAANVIPYVEMLCGKYITYEVSTSIVWMVIGSIITIPGLILLKLLNNNKEWGIERYHIMSDDYTGRIFSYIGVALLFIIPICVAANQIFDIVTCLTFPEKIIFDELKTLIN